VIVVIRIRPPWTRLPSTAAHPQWGDP